MAKLYSIEKGKYGGTSGFIYPFAKTLSSADPDDSTNAVILPAGFLPCDGTIYQAALFPVLAGILGVGAECKFKGDKTLSNTQFRVPDLGAKTIRASQSNIGEILNATVENTSGTLIDKAGVGALISNNQGSTAEIGYSGYLRAPSMTVDINGNPGFTVASTTSSETVNQLQIQPHAHYSTTFRMREQDNLGISVFTYRNSHTGNWCNGRSFDTRIDTSIVIAGRNLDYITNDGGNDANTEHNHRITKTNGINHTSTSTGNLHTYQANLDATIFRPDGLTSTVRLNTTSAIKFDDVSSPFILVQYLIKI